MSTTPRALTSSARTPIQTSPKPETSHLEGRYMTFTLGRQQFAIHAQQVRQIIGLTPLDTRDNMPSYMRGTVLLRGRPIPVVSLRARLGMPDPTPTGKECIIIFDLGIDVGLIVDEVNEVTYFNASQIAPPSPIVTAAGCTFILGIANVLGLANGHAAHNGRLETPRVGSTVRHPARRIVELAYGPLRTVTLVDIAEVVEAHELQAVMATPTGNGIG